MVTRPSTWRTGQSANGGQMGGSKLNQSSAGLSPFHLPGQAVLGCLTHSQMGLLQGMWDEMAMGQKPNRTPSEHPNPH